MKKTIFLILSTGLLAFCCEEHRSDNQCVSGKIVGEKCNVFALQLNEQILGATEWTKKNLITGEIEATFPNVIGLLNLPEEFRGNGKTLFVTLREPTPEENNIPCYADLPTIPSPYYVVLSVGETKCNDNAE